MDECVMCGADREADLVALEITREIVKGNRIRLLAESINDEWKQGGYGDALERALERLEVELQS